MRQSNAKQLQDLVTKYQKSAAVVGGSVNTAIDVEDEDSNNFLGRYASDNRDNDKEEEVNEDDDKEEEDAKDEAT